MSPERVTMTDEEARWFASWIERGALASELAEWLAAREQALREEIAGEVERKAQHLNAAEDYGRGGRDGLNAAARIARGGAR